MLSAGSEGFDAQQFVSEHRLDWKTRVGPNSSGPVHNMVIYEPPEYMNARMDRQMDCYVAFSRKHHDLLADLRRRAGRFTIQLVDTMTPDQWRDGAFKGIGLPNEFISAAAEQEASILLFFRVLDEEDSDSINRKGIKGTFG